MIDRCRDCISAIDTIPSVCESFELSQRGVKQSHAAAKSPALDMVIRRGELDQALKVDLLFTARMEPQLLPRFVCVPELMGVEESDAFFDQGHATRNILDQSPARVPLRNTSQIAEVKSVVEPVPPMSRVRTSGPIPSTLVMASPIRLAGPVSPM